MHFELQEKMFSKSIIILLIFLQISKGYRRTPALPNDNLSPHIIGGIEAPDGYAKHMVALVVGYRIRSSVCGASIVSRRGVLSAAHCIEPEVIGGKLSPQLNGVIGSNNWRSTDHLIKFSGYIIHPKYNRRPIKNDIGVIFTHEDIQYSHRIQPISLNWNWISSSRGFVTGWGLISNDVQIVDHEGQVNIVKPDHLQLLYVKTISPLECIIGVKKASVSWDSNPPQVNPLLEICTYHSIGHGMCNGDSGSALVEEESREQIGIVSWGFPCAIGAPDVFVRISAFKEFLLPIIEADLNL